MKVCTDTCFFGAWVANFIVSRRLPVTNCLDIGTGTGLLGLLLAQKTGLSIDAVEIEENAFKQAKQNFGSSPWSARLQAFHSDIKIFSSAKKYDFIISNPPFFENDLRSANKNKNIARHDEGLNLQELVAVVKLHLNDDGYFALLLPYHRLPHFETLAAQNNIFINEKLLIRQTPEHDFFRGILICSRSKKSVENKELVIKNKTGYTDEFTGLLKDYYLSL